FEAFEQADVTAVRRAGGLGLGLAIARTLVQLHGGVITAESEGEGRGATFAVELATTSDRPMQARPPAHGPDAAPPPPHRTSLPLVEDALATAEALALLLSENGFAVRTADSVARARAVF